MRVVDLTEHRWTTLDRHQLTESDAMRMLAMDRHRVKVDWPTAANGYRWSLMPDGWVGSVFVSTELGLRVVPKVSVQALASWIRWIVSDVNLKAGRAPPVDSSPALASQVLSLLLEGAESRLQRGIHREYRRKTTSGMLAKGRPLLRESLLKFAAGDPGLVFEQTTLTADVEDNRLLYWALHRIAMLNIATLPQAQQLHSLLSALAATVALVPYDPEHYKARAYHERNDDYLSLHALSALVLEGRGPEFGTGENYFGEFSILMWELFQRGVYLALRRMLIGLAEVEAAHIVRLGAGYVFDIDVLVVPKSGATPIVVEVKYKDPTEGPESEDVRQAVAYATAVGANKAFLVYPSKCEPPLTLSAGSVTVRTTALDMSMAPHEAAIALVRSISTAIGLGAT